MMNERDDRILDILYEIMDCLTIEGGYDQNAKRALSFTKTAIGIMEGTDEGKEQGAP